MGSFNEENYLNEKPHNSLATYAMTKKMLLQGIISCQLQKNLYGIVIFPQRFMGQATKSQIKHLTLYLIS